MADTAISALTAVGTVAGGDDFPCNSGGTTKRATANKLADFMGVQKKRLSSTVNSTSVTPAKVTGLDLTTGVGTFIFEYFIRWQAATATTGIKFDVNHSGTVTSFVWNQRYVDTSATAATAVPDQDAVGAAAQVMGAFASRAKGTAGRGVLLSADTAASDMLTIIEGLAVVTVTGDLQLYHGAEVAAAGNVSVMQDSVLRLTAVA